MTPPACEGCGVALPSAFPGASVVCACGLRAEIAGARPSSAAPTRAAGPYREAAPALDRHDAAPCPYCGNACPPLVRICPHCDVRLDAVRCQRCFTLQAPGEFACGRCKQALELEPLLDATDAPCPRCRHPLDAGAALAQGARVHECPRCGGIFLPRETLAEILCNAEVAGALPAGPPRRPRDLGEVRYLSCPLCHSSMNRVNFGKVSGVIVDVCKGHGTWFDAGELTSVVAFAAAGGLDKTRERERAEERVSRERSQEVRVELAVMEAKERASERLDAWRELLDVLFRW
ncbi:MAG: zf-TFIIB domain-containing protein [Labilithrix sp.]|nr:zf-TFIIB domain-containing protein [Labilithrix sp.]